MATGSALLLSQHHGWLICIPTTGRALEAAQKQGCFLMHCMQPVRVRAISPPFVTSGPVLSPAADFNE